MASTCDGSRLLLLDQIDASLTDQSVLVVGERRCNLSRRYRSRSERIRREGGETWIERIDRRVPALVRILERTRFEGGQVVPLNLSNVCRGLLIPWYEPMRRRTLSA